MTDLPPYLNILAYVLVAASICSFPFFVVMARKADRLEKKNQQTQKEINDMLAGINKQVKDFNQQVGSLARTKPEA